MARTFTAASSHKIITALGNLGFVIGPGTVAAIVRPASFGASNTAFSSGATNAASWMLQVGATGTGTISLRLNGTETHNTTVLTVSQWYCIVATKATGTATPRFHFYDYTAGAWTHENAVGTLANCSTPITQAQVGCTPAGAAFWGGDVAVCGAWNVVLTDAQVEPLAFSLLSWFQVQPRGLFVLDQAATTIALNDQTGGGANQSSITGTAVSANSVPVFSYGADLLEDLFNAAAVSTSLVYERRHAAIPESLYAR